MAKDFKASQVRTTQIIASGSTSGKPSLVILSASSPGVNFDGDGISNVPSAVGRDVFVFVSGSTNSFGTSTRGVTLFGGDIVVSGNLYNGSGGSYGNVAGSNKQVQFNDASSFGADSGLIYDKTTQALSVGTLYVTGTSLNVSGNARIGDASSDSLQVTSNAWYDSNLNVSGSTRLGDASTDSLQVTANSWFDNQLNVSGSTVLGNASTNSVTSNAKIWALSDLNVSGNMKIGDASSDSMQVVSNVWFDNSLRTSGSIWVNNNLNISGSTKLGSAAANGVQITGNSWFDNSVNVSGSLLIAGNLEVRGVISGTVLAITSTNLTISDQIIYLASGTKTANTDGGIAIASGSSVTNQSLVWGRVANDTWGAGRQDVVSGTVNSLTSMTFVPIRASKFEIGGSSAFVSSSNASSLELAAATQVLILSGGSSTSANPRNFSDINFFVSGSTNSRGTATRGTSLFGGDLYVSGAEYVAGQLEVTGNLKLYTDVILGKAGSSAQIKRDGDTSKIGFSSDGVIQLDTSNTSGAGIVKFSKNALQYLVISQTNSTNGASVATFLPGSSIGSFGFTGFNSDLASAGADAFFYVSGSTSGRGNSTGRAAVFGGHTIFSGAIYGGVNPDLGRTLLRQEAAQIAFSKEDGLSAGNVAGADVFMFVSGAIDSKDTTSRGASVFGGDVVISGTLHGGSPLKIGGSIALTGSLYLESQGSAPAVGNNESVLYVLDSGGTKKLYWKNSDGIQQEVGTGGGSGATSGTFNEVNSAGTISLVTTASVSLAGAKGFNYGVNQIGSDTFFFVSGSSGTKNSGNRGVSVFGGDTVMSGAMYVDVSGRPTIFSRNRGTDANLVLSGGYSVGGITKPFIQTETTNQNVSFAMKDFAGSKVEFIRETDAQTVAFISGSGYISGSTVLATKLSGSLTTLGDGTPYLLAGSNVTLTTGSNGAVTIASTGGGSGTPGGSDTQVQFNDGGSSFGGDSGLTYIKGTDTLNVVNVSMVATNDQVFQLKDNSAGALNIGAGTDNKWTFNTGNGQERLGFWDGVRASFGDINDPDLNIQHDGTNSLITNKTGALVLSGANGMVLSGTVTPGVDLAYNLGSPTNRFGNIYTGDLHLRNDRGNWTIVEEEDYLCVVNNKTGKKFKMALIPLEE